jgi:hypothetical protein
VVYASRKPAPVPLAGDPDEVARAIADGIAMDATVRNASAEDVATMLRDYVASLT